MNSISESPDTISESQRRRPETASQKFQFLAPDMHRFAARRRRHLLSSDVGPFGWEMLGENKLFEGTSNHDPTSTGSRDDSNSFGLPENFQSRNPNRTVAGCEPWRRESNRDETCIISRRVALVRSSVAVAVPVAVVLVVGWWSCWRWRRW